jgi:hypothetical protein
MRAIRAAWLSGMLARSVVVGVLPFAIFFLLHRSSAAITDACVAWSRKTNPRGALMRSARGVGLDPESPGSSYVLRIRLRQPIKTVNLGQIVFLLPMGVCPIDFT